jgi:hypothetical protein
MYQSNIYNPFLKKSKKRSFIRACLRKLFMEVVTIKGHKINFMPTRASHNRRALQFKNNIITALGKIGTKRDDVEIELNGFCGRESKSSITWYFNGHRLYYELALKRTFVDNLFIISKIIGNEIELVLQEQKPLEEFLAEFVEDEDVHDDRAKAREFFELKTDHKDIDTINKRYKELAKTLHPDMPTGDVEEFKKLNHHHKILKRELA